MKVGDWVFFRTRNWPSDVRVIKFEVTGRTADVTGEGLYSGRGRIVGIAGGNDTVREEETDRLVEVGLHRKKLQKELTDLNKEARKIKTRLKAIERRQAELTKELP